MKRLKSKPRVIFLQLPQVDNDVSPTNASENVHLAEQYLLYSLHRAGIADRFNYPLLPPNFEYLDQTHAFEILAEKRPDIVVATIYLWNIERTLDLLSRWRPMFPSSHVMIGGPEVSRPHPFLFRSSSPFDVAVEGEGEAIFPLLLKDYLSGTPEADFSSVYRKHAGRWVRGHHPPPLLDLNSALPPPDHTTWHPDKNGIAYLEASRGCPMRCSYCRYSHRRQRMYFISPHEIGERVKILRRRNAREIRFIDPMFNAHPQFKELLKILATINADHRVRFFAELKSDRLSCEVADLLAAAHFTDIEVGMQSRDPKVLSGIHRPTRLPALDAGVRLLTRRKIRVTLDVMYGLPGQSSEDVYRSLKHSLNHPRVSVQCLQTLLLPGTELRIRRSDHQLKAADLPPYGVTSTPTLSTAEMLEIESYLGCHPKLQADLSTRRFVGQHLPDLFPEMQPIVLETADKKAVAPGSQLRRALIIKSFYGFWTNHRQLNSLIRRSIRQEPFMLWQFVLAIREEEPLDLLDQLINSIRSFPPHLVDRYAACALTHRIASRRVFVIILPQAKVSRSWINSAEDVLHAHFY